MYVPSTNLYNNPKYPLYTIISYRFSVPEDVMYFRSWTTKILSSALEVEESQRRFMDRCSLEGSTLHSVKSFASSYPFFPEIHQSNLDDRTMNFKAKLDKLRTQIPDLQVRNLYQSDDWKIRQDKLAKDYKDRRLAYQATQQASEPQ